MGVPRDLFPTVIEISYYQEVHGRVSRVQKFDMIVNDDLKTKICFYFSYEMLANVQRDLTPEKAAEYLRNQSDVHYKKK